MREAVAEHKSIFFAEKDKQGNPIDYHAAVSGALQLVPTEDALAALADDYAGMVKDGLLLDEAEPFDGLLAQCQAVQDSANAGERSPYANPCNALVRRDSTVDNAFTSYLCCFEKVSKEHAAANYRTHPT